jgi:hypothetical protein
VIEILDARDEMAVVKEAGEAAVAVAILKGADPGDVRIVEIDKIPSQYVTNKATRIRVKAIGKLRAPVVISLEATSMPAAPSIHDSDIDETGEGETRPVDANSHEAATKPSLEIDITVYRPDIRDEIWYHQKLTSNLSLAGLEEVDHPTQHISSTLMHYGQAEKVTCEWFIPTTSRTTIWCALDRGMVRLAYLGRGYQPEQKYLLQSTR